MRYMGGKARVVRHLAEILSQALDLTGGRWIEPFTGGLNVLPAVAGSVTSAWLNDAAPGLINMYRALAAGEFCPPEEVTEEEYRRLRAEGGEDPLSTFAAYGCSFGGKRWGGYAREGSRNPDLNLGAVAGRSLLRALPSLSRVTRWTSQDYLALDLGSEPRSTIYCDPPYEGTTGYQARFDHDQFRAWCEEQAQRHHVLVSEYDGYHRPGWEIVWSRERQVALDVSQKQQRKLEVLMEVRV